MTVPDCPQCKKDDEVTQMSGVSLVGHDDWPLHLCFRCKIWIGVKGKMLQTI